MLKGALIEYISGFVYLLNESGERILPCGVPFLIFILVELRFMARYIEWYIICIDIIRSIGNF